MYEQFVPVEIDDTGQVDFKLFLPDDTLASSQYDGGGLPHIREIYVVGDFQSFMGDPNWTPVPATLMSKSQFQDTDGSVKGWLYTLRTPKLDKGFYQYKYYVLFEDQTEAPRYVGDPCSRYGGRSDQNSGFVIGGHKIKHVRAHADRTPYKDLIVYELMIDDFTHQFLNGRAPLDALKDKLDYLVDLGVNAIEFMPWTAWPSDDFSWGYNPFQYFSVAHPYTLDPQNPADKIYYLKRLIGLCHQRNINVIMDGVFNHVKSEPPHRGFGYYWLYDTPSDSPYVGNFADHAFFRDLDYANQCTFELMRDVCLYWMDIYKIDGIRFDNTLGYYKADDRAHGLPKLLTELRSHLADTGSSDFATILEHSWDYGAIAVTNQVGATSCWYDMFRSLSRRYMQDHQIDTKIMRMLNSSRDFGKDSTPTICIQNHDHEPLIQNAGGRQAWWRTQPYMIALFTCPGAVLIYNGQEFGENYPMPEPGAADADQRVQPRPLHWENLDDEPGQRLHALYKQLIHLRKDHPALRSPNFYPPDWDEQNQTLDGNGFGLDVSKQVVVYHRWQTADDGNTERYYIVLNFSDFSQPVEVQFAENGPWKDLLSDWQPHVQNNRLQFQVGSNWGHIFYKKS